ncbi:MAG TPA: prepilin-type N-terminal cleavage/methylation domain-containing protein [bacterium]|nr:prepilin-type N-terminal cleavage/methylation domain-containing protein [bacterium]
MRRSAPAFTLLEVLVALVITGIILALVAASFGSIFRAHGNALRHMELEQTLNESMERIRVLLQSAYLSGKYPNYFLTRFETMDTDNISDPYDSLTFTTLANTSHRINAKESDLIEVTLFTVDAPPLMGPNGPINVRRLRVRAGGDINSQFEVEGGQVYTLADNVTGFHLEYLNQFGEWKPEWIPGDNIVNNFPSLPCAVRVTVALRSQTLEEREASIMVPLEMARTQCRFDDPKVFEP